MTILALYDVIAVASGIHSLWSVDWLEGSRVGVHGGIDGVRFFMHQGSRY